jgi:hypothetical protein
MTTTLLEGSYPLAQRGEARRPVALIAGSAAPIVLEDRYRLLVAALVRLHRSRRSQWTLAVGSGAGVIVLGLLGAVISRQARGRRADTRLCSWQRGCFCSSRRR